MRYLKIYQEKHYAYNIKKSSSDDKITTSTGSAGSTSPASSSPEPELTFKEKLAIRKQESAAAKARAEQHGRNAEQHEKNIIEARFKIIAATNEALDEVDKFAEENANTKVGRMLAEKNKGTKGGSNENKPGFAEREKGKKAEAVR